MSEVQQGGIEVDGLVREFKGGVRAVDGIDLRVAPGEIYGFLGPNGAGKSTTVLVLTTLLPPTAGSARVAGFDVERQGADVRSARPSRSPPWIPFSPAVSTCACRAPCTDSAASSARSAGGGCWSAWG